MSSDFHYGHTNICLGTSQWNDKSGCRKFLTLKDMNDTIVDSINNVVMEDDILWHLGDWSFGKFENIESLRDRIFCKNIYHIFGNHDYKMRTNYSLQRENFVWCGDYCEIWTHFNNQKQLIVLSHYAMSVFNGSHKNSIQLFGHSHGTYSPVGRQLDVGWDVFKQPISLLEVCNLLKHTQPARPDHHNANTNVF